MKKSKPMKTYFEEQFEREYNTVDELVTSAVLSGVIDKGIKDDFILYIELVRNNGMYYEPTDLKFIDGGIEVPLTIKSLLGLLKQWEKEREYKMKRLGLDKPLRFEPGPQYETKRFKTSLSDTERKELCDNIISNNGALAKGEAMIFKDFESKHIPTLLYILGGEHPKRIEKIRVYSIERAKAFLKSISVHPHPYTENEICVPDFLKNALLNTKGRDIDKLK